MSRYVRDFYGNINPDALYAEINQYMMQEGYTYMNYKGENLYKKGVGMLSAPTFLKVSVTNTSARVEAFIKTAIVPGVYAGESGLDSFYGALPKSVLKTRVEVVEGIIMRHIGISPGAPNFGAQQQSYQPNFGAQQQSYQPNFGGQPQQPYQSQTPPQSGFVFCRNCGTKHDKSARFCNNCGYKMQ